MWKTKKVQKKSQKSRAKCEAKNGSKMALMNTKIWQKWSRNLHKNVGQNGRDFGPIWPCKMADFAAFELMTWRPK